MTLPFLTPPNTIFQYDTRAGDQRRHCPQAQSNPCRLCTPRAPHAHPMAPSAPIGLPVSMSERVASLHMCFSSSGTRDHSRVPRVLRQLLPTAFFAMTAASSRMA